MKRHVSVALLLGLMTFLLTINAHALTMYIGDVDGFGYGNAAGYFGADGNPAERNNTGVLDSGDVLPDRNRNGSVATGSGDDFDLRSAAEIADVNNTGLKWTDVALSTSYAGRPGLARDASFTFYFSIDPNDPYYGKDHFINLVYGDYDVNPMTAVVEGQTVSLLGNSAGGVDGYIWRAYAAVSWADMLDGVVVIDIVAPSEPYVTFDYALLDTDPINTDVVPEPATMLLLGSGLAGLAGFRRRFHKK